MTGLNRPTPHGRALGAARAACALLVAFCALLPADLATAQSGSAPASDKAAAESLFDRGLDLMRQGKLSEACESLEQSQAIEAGIGTMLYLAECYEKTGRTASAWALFREASSRAAAAGQTERAEAGKQRAEQLEGKLSTLTVTIAEASQVEGLSVLRDGTALNEGLWNLPVPVDPGTHQLEARAPGYKAWKAEVTVADAAQASVEIPALEAAPEEVAARTEPEPATFAAPITHPVTQAPPPDPRTGKLQLSSLIVGGAAVVTLGIGTVYGIRAINRNNDSKELCSGSTCSKPRGVTLSNQAFDDGRKSNGFLAAGAVLAVGAGTLYWLAYRSEKRDQARSLTPHLSFDTQSLHCALGGTF